MRKLLAIVGAALGVAYWVEKQTRPYGSPCKW